MEGLLLFLESSLLLLCILLCSSSPLLSFAHRGADVGFPRRLPVTTTTTMPTPHPHHRAVDCRRHHGSGTAPFPLLLSLLLSVLWSAAKAQPSPSSPQNPYGNFRGGFGPAMGIIVVILFSAFFFMVFFSIYLRRRGDPSVGPGGVAGGTVQGARSRQVAARGLDPSVVQAFPALVYAEVKEHKIGKGALECAVCLSEFEDDETLRLLPKCDHVFHTDCIDIWLASHTTCPVCRSNLDPNADVTPQAAEAAAAPSADAGASAAAVGEEEEETQRQGGDGGERPDHVAIVVEEPEAGERMRRMESKSRLRWRWSGSLARPPLRFTRSHSTGHSVAAVPPGEDCERYTLRLPDHIRRDVVAGKFQTSASTRKGHRAGGDGSSRGAGGTVGGRSFKLRKWEWAAKSDRWAFFSRTLSMVVTRGGDDSQAREGSTRRGTGEGPSRKGEEAGAAAAAGEGSVKGKKVFPAV